MRGSRRAVATAIGFVLASSEEEALAVRQGLDDPAWPQPAWRRVGFDVADGGIIGLSNTRCNPAEVHALRDVRG